MTNLLGRNPAKFGVLLYYFISYTIVRGIYNGFGYITYREVEILNLSA